MPLQDMQLPILMSGGVDTKTDSKSVNLGKLLVLENGVFENPGKIRKRFGYNSLGNDIESGGTFSDATNIAANINTNQLITLAENKVFSYLPSTGKYAESGSFYPTTVKATSEVDNYTLSGSNNCSMAIVSGREIYSYSAISNVIAGVQLTIKDQVTKNVTYQTFLLEAPAVRTTTVKLISDASYAYQFKYRAVSGSNPIIVNKIDPLLASPIVATASLARTAPATGPEQLDALLLSSGNIAVIYITGSTSLTITILNSSLTTLYTTAITTPANVRGISVAEDSVSQNLYVFYAYPTNVAYQVLSSTLTPVLAATDLYVADPFSNGFVNTQFYNVTARGTDNGDVLAVASSGNTSAFASPYELLSKFTVNEVGVTFTDLHFAEIGTICSKITKANDKFWFVFGFVSSTTTGANGTQSTYFLQEITLAGTKDVNTLGSAARFLTANALTSNYLSYTPRPDIIVSGTSLTTALQVRSSLAVKADIPINAVYKMDAELNDSIHSSITTIPDTNFLISSGVPTMFDVSSSEQGFNWFPEITKATISGVGGNLAAGQYQYYWVWEWVDSKGQVHQSAPSIAETVTVAATGSVEISMGAFINTTKDSGFSPVLYRTTVNGVTAYRLPNVGFISFSNSTARTYNNGYFTYTDLGTPGVTDDATIVNNQILYTTGGILPNDPAPNSSFQWLYKNRVMLGGLDDGNTIWYSKTRVAGEPIKFSALFFTNVDIAGGDVTAGGTLDDKCIFFKKNKIFYMYGDGPNDAGGGQAFSIPQEISSPVGCAYPKSVVAMPLGLMFKSEKGIYLLDRGLNASYIGYPVEQYNQYDITSAIHMAKYNQVIFTLSNGTALVFDYLVQQWGVYTNVSAIGSTLYENEHTYVQSNGITLQQGASYLDSGTTPITLTIGLPWIKLNGLQGFQRAREFLLLGEYKSPHTLSVSMAYNYNDTYTQTATFTPTNASVLQFRTFLTLQKCEALKVLISDNGTATTGEGFNLSEMMLEIGVKKGHFKLSSSKSVS